MLVGIAGGAHESAEPAAALVHSNKPARMAYANDDEVEDAYVEL